MPLIPGFGRKPPDKLAELTHQLERNPRDVLAFRERGEEYLLRREFDLALRDARRALQIALTETRLQGDTRQTLFWFLYMLESRALLGLGDNVSALQSVDRALEYDPNNTEGIVQRGRVLLASGNPQAALADFDKVLTVDSRSISALLGRGMALGQHGNNIEAIAEFEKVIDINPKAAVAWSNLGSTYIRLRRWADAEKACRTAIQIDPWLIQAYDKLANALLELQRPDDALRVLQDGLQYHPAEPTHLVNLAHIYAGRQQYGNALEAVNRSLQGNPANPEALRLRASISYQTRNFQAAIEDSEYALKLEPEHAETYFNLALAHLRMRNFDAAQIAVEQTLRLAPSDVEAQQLQEKIRGRNELSTIEPDDARVYLALGNKERAFAEWNKQIQAARKAGLKDIECDILLTAGAHYIKEGDTRKGEDYIRKALPLADACKRLDLVAQAHIELGSLAMSARNYAKAISHFEQVYENGKAINNKRYQHLGLGNHGTALISSNRVEQGITYLKQARVLAHEIGEFYEESNYCFNIGFGATKIPDPLESVAALEEVNILRAKAGLPPDEKAAAILQEIKNILKK